MDQLPIRMLRAARQAAYHCGLEPLLKRSHALSSLYRNAYSHVRPDGFADVDLPGYKLTISASDSSIAYNLLTRGAYEPFESRLFTEAVADGGNVIDVGAHVGYYALMAASMARGDNTVWAFEPHPANYRLLEHNIARNHLENTVAINAAASDHVGMGYLYEAQDQNTGGHSLVRGEGQNDFVAVPLVTVDQIVPPGTDVCAIKIDTEGGEVEVLRGMNRVLSENNPVVFIEFFPSALERAGHKSRMLLEMLNLSFDLAVIDNDRETLTPMSVDEIIRSCPIGGALNLLCKTP